MSIAEFVASVQQAKLVAEANGPGATQASVFLFVLEEDEDLQVTLSCIGWRSNV